MMAGGLSYQLVPFRFLLFLSMGLGAGSWREEAASEGEGPGRGLRRIAFRVHWGVWGLMGLCLIAVPTWQAVADRLLVTGHLEEAVQVDPWHGRARLLLGKAYLASGRVDEACELLAGSLKTYPDLGTLLDLGQCQAAAGDLDAAEAWFLKATFWNPRYFMAYSYLGHVYWQKGDLEAAYRYIVRAESLRPSDPRVLATRKLICRDNPFCR